MRNVVFYESLSAPARAKFLPREGGGELEDVQERRSLMAASSSSCVVCIPKARLPLLENGTAAVTLSAPTLPLKSSLFGQRIRAAGLSLEKNSTGVRAAVDPNVSVMADVSKSPTADILETWKKADAVCFDVDSTVCEDEGIDELAAFCGAGEAVAAWTTRAMGGVVPFEVALASRLELFQPSASTLASFLASRPPRLTPGIADLVGTLHKRGTHVYLVSGGFRQMIEPAASILGIPIKRIYANKLLFNDEGDFTGFDATEPTSRSGGKALVIEKIKQEHGYKSLVMVGDGATDLEARRPGGADIFICFGGVISRPKVVAGADWFVLNFEDLIRTA